MKATRKRDVKHRIAIIDPDRCKPRKCQQECRRNCPVNAIGKQCVTVKRSSKLANIAESLCTGCGICVKTCPFDAIQIINLPTHLKESDTVHRYGANGFKLHRLPLPHANQVVGFVGQNGIGKTTALRILQRQLKPNLGNVDDPDAVTWAYIVQHYRGTALQAFFQKQHAMSCKPQHVLYMAKVLRGTVREQLHKRSTLSEEAIAAIIRQLRLAPLLNRTFAQLSGGELQRVAIALTCLKAADVYVFDEPSSFLDVKQRLAVANLIRTLRTDTRYVFVVEHDLALLDYMSDTVCLLYGKPGAYGVVTAPMSTREGINQYLDGFIQAENMRFRPEPLKFQWTDVQRVNGDEDGDQMQQYRYPQLTKSFSDFTLTVEPGHFCTSSLTVLLGENGTGKSTFIQLLAGRLKADNDVTLPTLRVSYKPQVLSPKYPGTVRALFQMRLGKHAFSGGFHRDVVVPLGVKRLFDHPVKFLSGGELQRVAICLVLGKPADVYLIDEPSAYLDSEQRMAVATVLKRYVLHKQKTAFVVEHDMMMATYLADQVIVFEGEPARRCTARRPETLATGMNRFLRKLNVTFRRDRGHTRPRINKLDSVKDRKQKADA